MIRAVSLKSAEFWNQEIEEGGKMCKEVETRENQVLRPVRGLAARVVEPTERCRNAKRQVEKATLMPTPCEGRDVVTNSILPRIFFKRAVTQVVTWS